MTFRESRGPERVSVLTGACGCRTRLRIVTVLAGVPWGKTRGAPRSMDLRIRRVPVLNHLAPGDNNWVHALKQERVRKLGSAPGVLRRRRPPRGAQHAATPSSNSTKSPVSLMPSPRRRALPRLFLRLARGPRFGSRGRLLSSKERKPGVERRDIRARRACWPGGLRLTLPYSGSLVLGVIMASRGLFR